MSCEQCSSPSCPTKSMAASGSNAPRKASAPAARIALLGQPNSGKSTLFNGLTGARQHVGNWPGKTVERKVGRFRHNDKWFEVVDLPGSYSLAANSPEEEVASAFVSAGESDVTVVFADASQLERSMYMLAEYVGVDCPTVLALNMMDVAERQGKVINVARLQDRLGIPVVPMVASNAAYYPKLYDAIDEALSTHSTVQGGPHIESESSIEATALAGAENVDSAVISWQAKARYDWIESILDGVVSSSQEMPEISRFDRWVIGSWASKPLALVMILLGFLLAFIPATPIMAIGMGVSSLGQVAAEALLTLGVPALVSTFLSGVVFNSLCFGIMMVGYVFGINLVFGIYEDTGYMARISYVFDNTLARFGLQGKSVMPFLMCLGCTMGGISGSRVVDSWGQRMLTIAMSWAIPCSTTWGVVPVLAVAFFGMGAPLVIIAIFFFVTVVLMWVAGKLFGPRLVPADARKGLVMELPPYHKPHVCNILRQSLLKSWSMFKRAIKVVSLFSVVIWALTYSSTGGIEGSLLYVIGHAIEPVTLFFGLTWETFIAWLCGMVIKESALGVLSGLFAGTTTLNAAVIGAASASVAVDANIGNLIAQAITAPQLLAFIFAFTFNMPCAASVSATYGEIHSAKWTALIAVFYIAASLILGCAVYHIALLF